LHRDSATILAGIEQLQRTIKSTSRPADAVVLIRPIISWLVLSRRDVEKDLDHLQECGRALEALDSEQYAALHQRVRHLPKAAQTNVRRELHRVRQRLRMDESERQLVQKVAVNTSRFTYALKAVVAALQDGKVHQALKHAATAQRLEAEAQKLSNAITVAATQYQQEASRIVTRATLSPEALSA
jgi:uncharacterized protein YdiU (UPF0061 family)